MAALLLGHAAIALALVAPAAVAAVDPGPTLTTDKADYMPGETVHIAGTGFVPGVAYDIPVIRPDGSIVKGDGSFLPGWDTVSAGLEGSFTYDYILNGIVGLYEVRAYLSPWSGDTSEPPIAGVTFTDAVQERHNQLQNNAHQWDNGNINSSNSSYTEGESVAYRYEITGITDNAGGTDVRIEIHYEFERAGSKAFDFLTSVDRTEAADIAATGGLFGDGPLSTLTTASCNSTALAIPDDPTHTFDNALVAVEGTQYFTICGAFTGASLVSGPVVSGLEKVITIKLDVANTPGAGNAQVAVFWGGHLAVGTGHWGTGLGAASLSGAPFHQSTGGFVDHDADGVDDGGSEPNLGSGDRSVQTGGIALGGVVQITVNKDFVPNNGADVSVSVSCTSGTVSTSDSTASESDPANFTVTGFSSGATCTATESVPPGYTADQSACANLTMSAGVDRSCTITNADAAPTVTLVKTASPTTLPEPGGLFTFTLTITNTSGATDTVTITGLSDSQSGAADASNSFSDCAVLVGTTLAPGASVSCSYAVAHSQPGTYSNTASVTVSDEEASTASDTDDETVTVTDVAPSLSVTKTASPTSVSEGGVGNQLVTFTYTVTNTSSASTDPVTITSLSDSAFGPLAGDADCQVGTVLAPGASCSFTASFAVPSQDAGTSHTNTFTANGTDDESSAASASASASVTYSNVAPSVIDFTCTSPIDEGSSTTCTATITGGGSTDAYTCVFNWGPSEGTSSVAASGNSCTATHLYADDNPTGTNGDDYTVSVTVTDDENTSDTESTTVHVNNVAPSLSATVTPSSTFTNNFVTASGSYTDVGIPDTHTVTIDWGDGSPDTVVADNTGNGGGSFTAQHQYEAAGTYTVTITVCDDDGGCDVETFNVSVSAGPVGNGTLITNSAFQIADDLGPWTITEFEILTQAKDGTIVATNPGQFYQHTRVVNSSDVTASIDVTLDWDAKGFITHGATPVHCYLRPPTGGWIETACSWTVNNDLTGGYASATIANVPAGYTAWVTVHLDYRPKGTKDTSLTPKVYVFASSWSINGVPTGSDATTLIGYPKKTTLIYGFVTDAAGSGVLGAEVTITLGGGVQCTYTTGSDGFYVFYAGQARDGSDGIDCAGVPGASTGTLALPNGTYALSVTPPPGYQTPSSATVNVNAQGKAFRKDWKLIAI